MPTSNNVVSPASVSHSSSQTPHYHSASRASSGGRQSQRTDKTAAPGQPRPFRTKFEIQQYTSSRTHSSIPLSMRNSRDTDIIQSQQQRLLLLRHAVRCPEEGPQCDVTPHCNMMKRLWKHMATCKQNQCPKPHCFSSRHLLSHYSRCRHLKCIVCAPVLADIKFSEAKASRNMRTQNKNASHSIQNNPKAHMSQRIRDITLNQLQEKGFTLTGKIKIEAQYIAKDIETSLRQNLDSEDYLQLSNKSIGKFVANKLDDIYPAVAALLSLRR